MQGTGWEQAQTWKSCVYSLLRGYVRVHQEEQAPEVLIEMKSYRSYTEPCEKILPLIQVHYRALTSQVSIGFVSVLFIQVNIMCNVFPLRVSSPKF